jgi:hypothetical protein
MFSVRKVFANKSGTDLTGYDGYWVVYDTSGMALCSGITDKAVGVLTKGGATESEVCILGECQAIANEAIGAGKFLSPASTGKTALTASTAKECALALDAVASGAFGPIWVTGSRNTAA